jgi:hypothetical protein
MKDEDNMMEKKNEMRGEGKRSVSVEGIGASKKKNEIRKKIVSHLRCLNFGNRDPVLTHWAKMWSGPGGWLTDWTGMIPDTAVDRV